jgi:hypothetical protein
MPNTTSSSVKQYPKMELNTMFLLAAGIYYFCSIRGRVVFFGDSLGNVNLDGGNAARWEVAGADLDDRVFRSRR